MVNPETGEIYAEAGDELTAKRSKALIEAGFDEIPCSTSIHINVGAYIRNTLNVDKNPAARKLCSTSTASCVPASRRRMKPPKPCSSRCSSTRAL
jgi:hypothetical protein